MPLFGSDRGDDRKELIEEQQRQARHSDNLRTGDRRNRETDFLEALVESPARAVDSHHDNLLSKDLPLANFTDEEVHDHTWMIQYYLKAYEDMHPPPESHLKGEYRKFLMDDPLEGFGHLRSAERLETEEFMAVIKSRVTRGRDMEQQEQLDKSVRVSETREHTDDEAGEGWFQR